MGRPAGRAEVGINWRRAKPQHHTRLWLTLQQKQKQQQTTASTPPDCLPNMCPPQSFSRKAWAPTHQASGLNSFASRCRLQPRMPHYLSLCAKSSSSACCAAACCTRQLRTGCSSLRLGLLAVGGRLFGAAGQEAGQQAQQALQVACSAGKGGRRVWGDGWVWGPVQAEQAN